jgi:large subunit ribosomal protein L17
MRHRSKRHSFHRRPGPRLALIRGLVYSLVENGRIKTTLAKAKEIKRQAEKAITVGKRGGLHARRILLSRYPNEGVVETLLGDLSKRFAKREGGYTRIVKLGARPGDQADVAYLEFVDFVPPKATNAEAVKPADEKLQARVKANVIARAKVRRNVRKIQNKSRRESRA